MENGNRNEKMFFIHFFYYLEIIDKITIRELCWSRLSKSTTKKETKLKLGYLLKME